MSDQTHGRILFVDDEPQLLAGIKRNLRRSFNIETAESGSEGLKIIGRGAPFSVVVSDMQMPEMNGSEFLSRVRKISPDTIRIMLTGDAGQKTAVSAINKAEVFKFVNKPCDAKTLDAVLRSALKEFDRVQLEHSILEKTVQGSINMMTEVLGLAMPEVFGRSVKIREVAEDIALHLEYKRLWKLRSACMLAHIGGVSMSECLSSKLCHREPVEAEDLIEYQEVLEASSRLLCKIPRLELLGDIIRHSLVYADNSSLPKLDNPESIPVESKIIRIALDIDQMSTAKDKSQIHKHLTAVRNRYDPVVIEAALAALEEHQEEEAAEEASNVEPAEELVRVAKLTDSMELVGDVVDKNGVLIVCAGWQTKENIRLHLRKAAMNGMIGEEVLIRRLSADETKDN